MIEKGKYAHETSSRRWTPSLLPRADNTVSRVVAIPPRSLNENGEGSRLPTTIKRSQTCSEIWLHLVWLRRLSTPSAAPKDANAPAMLFPMPSKSLNASAGSRLPTTISNYRHHLLASHSPGVVQKLARSSRSSSTGHATENTVAENLCNSIDRLEVVQ